MKRTTICRHPLLADTLGRLRDRNTSPKLFRKFMEDAGVYLGLAALEELRVRPDAVRTPMKGAKVKRLSQPIIFTVILRAGLGMLPGLSRLLPDAHIGHIGLYRDDETLNPVRYYVRLPHGLKKSFVLLLDPMLATGGSAAEAIRILKMDGAKKVTLACLLATKEGIRRVHREHPETPIMTAAIDPVLNANGYIVPGLGDAGDRLYGTGD